jgi:hypothetical protein
MKTATREHKPDWLQRPPTITAINVCRISGKLPSGGCDHVDVVNRDGLIETRSMVYTEYFIKGTVPSETCPVHESPSFLDRLAGVFGKDNGPAPLPSDQVGIALPPSVGTSAPPSSSTQSPTASVSGDKGGAAEEQKRKRGFWSRVFGIGKGKQDEKKPETPRKPGGKPPQ